MNVDLICYKKMPLWTKASLPPMVQEKHNTKVGTWGKLSLLKGKLKFYRLTEQGDVISEQLFQAGQDIPFIEPQAWHKVEAASEDLECRLAFYCTKGDYFHKKYGMTATHSEVKACAHLFAPQSHILDLGCGQGRNSLYLSLLGHKLTALDHNPTSLAFLQQTAEQENLEINTALYDINQATIEQDYDAIISTVVLMFLEPQAIPKIIANMQQQTKQGGYNLIVAAMSTDDVPCPMPFSFTFKENELKQYYQGWRFLKYQEEMGELHKTDANGNRIKLKFVTMLAQKP